MNTTIRRKLGRLIALLTVALMIVLSGQAVYAQDGKGKNKLGNNPLATHEVITDASTVILGDAPSANLDAPDASLTTVNIT